jgi:predicted RNase H-like nuclease (RuvC/YqgF family)
MEDVSVLVSGIEYKIKMLAQKNQTLIEENTKLKQQILELNTKVLLQESELESLSDKAAVLSVSKTLSSDTDRQSAKKKINELVREIDECLNLLNK